VSAVLTIYALGVAIGLVMTDARPLARVVIALLWPLGPLAFVATIATLVATAAVAFPVFGALLTVAAGAGWYWLL
jgi:hypothetical protein